MSFIINPYRHDFVVPASAETDGSTGYLSYTAGTDNATRAEFILFTWFKPVEQDANKRSIFSWWKVNGGSNYNSYVSLDVGNRLQVNLQTTGSPANYITNATFDASTWHPLLVSVDTNAGAGNTVRIWTEGGEISSWNTQTDAGAGTNVWGPGNSALNLLGCFSNDGSARSEFRQSKYAQAALIIDKSVQQGDYSITDFVDDAGGGSYSPKDFSVPTLSNNYLLDFSNGGALGTDASANGNDFSVTATVTHSTSDVPS